MYKAVVRWIRRGIDKLNAGDISMRIERAHPDVTIVFPGDDTWTRIFRPVEAGRHLHATHRGLGECATFAERLVAEGNQFVIEDILVNGPPWNESTVSEGAETE
ncbi:MAG: hypothetical protein OEW30_19485 [Acidimicrobiia bacterium]|nr:hypothetical protein [Acidimicrobiia bacterium]